MTNLNSISETIAESFCDRSINFAGIVDFTASRDGKVLRKVIHENGFKPVVWEGNVLAFIVLDEITYSSTRNGIGEAELVVISNHYGDHKLILASLDRYDVQEIKLNLNSQEIYNQYFDEDENRPFQGFAFTMKFQFSDSIAMCCDSFEKTC